ncbi:MAG: hypothetical protein HUJ25_02710 [Crocinitomicaceae bacterium]|nr:hypothetical protein [Crocinitomicaceae bacterium]
MPYPRVIQLLLLLVLVSCKQGKFTEQKYTNLKPLEVSSTENHCPEKHLIPEDTLKKGEPDAPIYLKTEKGYYIVETPSLDPVNSVITAGNIRRTKGPDTSRKQVIIYMKEENYYLIDEVELKRADSIFYREQRISADSLNRIIKKQHLGSIKEVSNYDNYQKEENRKLKILSIILGIFTFWAGVSALIFYSLGNSIDQNQGCIGALFATAFLIYAAYLIYIAGALLLCFLFVLILYLHSKNRL